MARPNEVWVTDITYIRTHEGWLYLAVVLDLYSRRVVVWSLQSRIKKELVLGALLMAVWRRKPTSAVTVHSDQGSQYTSHDWQNFLKVHGLQASMSRRGNCHDNAVAEFCDIGWTPHFTSRLESYSLTNTNHKWRRELNEQQKNNLNEVLNDYLRRYNYA